MSQQQQTVLRVYSNFNANEVDTQFNFEVLDTEVNIPIKINRSFAELQDIGKKNSDFSFNIKLPGTKKNNRFFESFYDVDVQTLYFNPNYKVPCDVLINDESYFKGYLRLNRISVKNSQVEYDVTLYSEVGNLFGEIGNNLLIDLNYDDPEYTFNHNFDSAQVVFGWNKSIWGKSEKPPAYFYPVVHNGYLYTGNTVNFSGGTFYDKTNLYTSTEPIGAYDTLAAFKSAGGQENRINTPLQGIYDNQLKPAMSVWNLLKLLFKTYGYTISGDFMKTPWAKGLYMYGYFNASDTKFSYRLQEIQTLPLEGVEIIAQPFDDLKSYNLIVCKKYTGIPCYCDTSFNVVVQIKRRFTDSFGIQWNSYPIETKTIPANSTGITVNLNQTVPANTIYRHYERIWDSPVIVADLSELKYDPTGINQTVNFIDGDIVDFNKVIDTNIKQIDFLSSIVKKFNLILTPNPNNTKDIIIEPFSHYVGTGDVYDWTDKLSFDNGFTVEPAINQVESNIIIMDVEDGDYGNKIFKETQNRIYGEMRYYGPTDFKSQEKKIETIFGPQVLRQWDTVENIYNKNKPIQLPLCINYAGTTNSSDNGAGQEQTNYTYTGVKTKPKLFFNVCAGSPFFDTFDDVYDFNKTYKSYQVWVSRSDGTFLPPVAGGQETIPVVSHTMPMGVTDEAKAQLGFENDSLCLLFNSEDTISLDTLQFNTYTDFDAWSVFYSNRINNITNGNTRFLRGKFYIKPNEYKKLKVNDLIKIKDQYFIWNKIEGYNLSDVELTDVELVQINNKPSVYPTRYFKYTYCDHPEYSFKFKTDFTADTLLDTNFGYSVTYDYSCGIVYTGNTIPTGYCTTYAVNITGTTYYVPYFIEEITKTEYASTSILGWESDTMHNHIWAIPEGPYGSNMPAFWINSGFTKEGLNLFINCDTFNTAKTTNGIRTIASDYFGPPEIYFLNTENSEDIKNEDNNNIQIEYT